jgi:hypothetical protein
MEQLMPTLAECIDLDAHPLASEAYRAQCKHTLDTQGVLTMPGFLTTQAIESVRTEGAQQRHLAYFADSGHNVYLAPSDPAFSAEHPRNRQVVSSKGCIQTDQIPEGSPLHTLYDSPELKAFLCAVLDEQALYEYADDVSSINLHYADEGRELGWHFDNSSFAITLLVQRPQGGGEFEFVRDARDADAGDMNYALVADVLDGKLTPAQLDIEEGTLVLFRGRDALHRVTPTTGAQERMLAVLAYNTEPGIALSKEARLTFFGRL